MSRRLVPVLIIAALAAGLGLWASQRLHAPAAPALPATRAVTLLPTPRVLPAFALQQADGQPLTQDSLKGHWTVVFLGFTHCPDVCPTTLAELARRAEAVGIPARRRPPARAVRLGRPGTRHPAAGGRVRPRLPHGHPRRHRAAAAAGAFARSLSLVFMKVPGASGDPADYSIDHSAALVLLDPQARMAGVTQPPFDVKGIAADLEMLTQSAR